MPKSDYDFTYKFFRPPQRTVPFRKGLLDTRTKHTIAQDRFVIAEQRFLDAERRKSFSNIQALAFEQKQLEKKLTKIYTTFNTKSIDRPSKPRGRSTSELVLHNIRRSQSWTDTLPICHRSALSVSLQNSNQNLLSLPKIDDIQRRFSNYSDGDVPDNHFYLFETESSDENDSPKPIPKISSPRKLPIKRQTIANISEKQTKRILPIVAVIPPDEDVLFVTQ